MGASNAMAFVVPLFVWDLECSELYQFLRTIKDTLVENVQRHSTVHSVPVSEVGAHLGQQRVGLDLCAP